MKTKFFSAAVAGALVLSLTAPAFAAGFSDTESHWASSQISRWSNLGVISGYNGEFNPNASITRGDMAVILDRIMGYQTHAFNSFIDLSDSAYYASSVLGANAAGVLSGDGTTVRPTAPITRQEACVLIGRALAVPTATDVSQFSDSDQIASWARGYVAGLAARGIISGSNGEFRPTAPITRAEAVTVFNHAIASLLQSAGKYYNVDTMETVVVRAPGVQIHHSVIYRDLILAEGIGNGEAALSNVTIVGSLIVRGGSKITLNNVKVYRDIRVENNAVIEETPIEDYDNTSILVTSVEDE